MVDFIHGHVRIETVGREDRALQRCTLSARSMPEDGQEHVLDYMLLPSRSSFGCKAINLLNWGEAPSQVKERNYNPPVGHMSIFCCPMTHNLVS